MPESKADQNRHSNEEITNFLTCGDARGAAWLANHPADRERAMTRMHSRDGAFGLLPRAAGERTLAAVPNSGLFGT